MRALLTPEGVLHALQAMEVFYTPEDIWRIQEELKGIKAVQAKHGRQLHNHSERLLHVERRGDESKIQNLWTSYFPSVHAPPNFSQRMFTYEPSPSAVSIADCSGYI